jgi:hypothetical protein
MLENIGIFTNAKAVEEESPTAAKLGLTGVILKFKDQRFVPNPLSYQASTFTSVLCT